jgi:hypothetical protein
MAKAKLGARKPVELKREVKKPAPRRDLNKKPTASDMIRDGADAGRFM